MAMKIQGSQPHNVPTQNTPETITGPVQQEAIVDVSEAMLQPQFHAGAEASTTQTETAAHFAQSAKAPSPGGFNPLSLQIAQGTQQAEVTAPVAQAAPVVSQPIQQTAPVQQVEDPAALEKQRNAETVTKFYKAMQEGDFDTIMSLYHPDAEFSDPAFPGIKGDKLEGMWKLITNAEPDIKFRDVKANDDGTVTGHWDADYELLKGNPIHNQIDSKFEFKDGKIIKHTDSFNFSKWADQAFPGILGKAIGTRVGQFVMTRMILPFAI
ncbi:MAG: nuclear transport factor 2 family protein [Deltaproteobacteria bacterium]|nr:MAG: nuclear transport factor 2 family protein [Deltaproteobacteria bacterium]